LYSRGLLTYLEMLLLIVLIVCCLYWFKKTS